MLDPEGHKQKTAANRANGARFLTERGIRFASHNKGAHLVVGQWPEAVDYWPGTGLWIVRQTGKKGRGIFSLLKHLKR